MQVVFCALSLAVKTTSEHHPSPSGLHVVISLPPSLREAGTSEAVRPTTPPPFILLAVPDATARNVLEIISPPESILSLWVASSHSHVSVPSPRQAPLHARQRLIVFARLEPRRNEPRSDVEEARTAFPSRGASPRASHEVRNTKRTARASTGRPPAYCLTRARWERAARPIDGRANEAPAPGRLAALGTGALLCLRGSCGAGFGARGRV